MIYLVWSLTKTNFCLSIIRIDIKSVRNICYEFCSKQNGLLLKYSTFFQVIAFNATDMYLGIHFCESDWSFSRKQICVVFFYVLEIQQARGDWTTITGFPQDIFVPVFSWVLNYESRMSVSYFAFNDLRWDVGVRLLTLVELLTITITNFLFIMCGFYVSYFN